MPVRAPLAPPGPPTTVETTAAPARETRGPAGRWPRFQLLGFEVDNLTMDAAVSDIMRALDGEDACQATFVNADCGNLSARHPRYRDVIRRSTWVFGDGSGVRMASKLLGAPIVDNVNGTDMFPLLCEAMSGTGKRLFLLGARPGIADGVAEWVREHHPDTIVCGAEHGYFDESETDAVVERIRSAAPDLLLVAFGAPRQDEWVARHLAATGAKVGMGVGGLFDFFSGRIPRAPMWMRRLGIEWCWRFIQEPRRMWKRYLVGNFTFLFRVLVQRIRGGRV